MPTSIVAAVAGGAVSSWASTYFGSQILGAIAGGVVSASINSLFGGSSNDAPAFEQQLRNRSLTVRQPITGWQIIYGQARVGGALTYIEARANNAQLMLVITLAGHVCEEIGDIYFGDELVELDSDGFATGKWAPGGTQLVRIYKSLGDETGQPFPRLVELSADKWTDAHRQTGRAKLLVLLTANNDVFPTGLPNITAVVKGRKVFDPRTGLTAWSANSALCTNDYLCHEQFGLASVYDDEIDEDLLMASANVSDEDVALAAGGTEKRYETNGSFSLPSAPREALPELLGAMQGRAVLIGGVWRIRAGAYMAGTETFDEDDARAPIRIATRLSRRDGFNAVKGVFVDPASHWQPTDFPPVTNATYLAEDNDERVWRDIKLNFTTSASMAQRIAKIELERSRQQITVQFPGKLSTWRVQPPEIIGLTNTRLGWTAKEFELVELQLAVDQDDDGVPILGVDHTLREIASSVYDWNSGEETILDPAPNTNLPNPFEVAATGAPTITETLYETRDARGLAAKAILTWTASPDGFIAQYQAEYRVVGATDYIVLPRTSALTIDILDIAPGRYDFRVKAFNQIGVSSAYSESLDVEILGLSAVPATPTGLSIFVAGNLAILKLAPATELDVRQGGRVLVRHSESVATPPWEESFSIGDPEGEDGATTLIVRPLKQGTYLLKFRDSTGQESTDPARITTKQASVLAYSTLDTLQEDNTFPGTHDNTVVDGVVLQLDSAGLFDDIAALDSVTDLGALGGIESEGTYTFDAGFDFLAVDRVRLTGIIEGVSTNIYDNVDDRIADIDDWLSFDGTGSGSATDAWLEIRETDDDPTGAPTWGDWKRLDSAEVEAWGVEARLQLRSTDPAYNILISTLRVRAEQVV